MIVSLSAFTVANAEGNPTMTVTATPKNVGAGQDVTVTVAYDLKTETADIPTLQFTLGYDESLFEYQSCEEVKKATLINSDIAGKVTYSWMDMTGGSATIKDVSSDVLKVVLKAKEDFDKSTGSEFTLSATEIGSYGDSVIDKVSAKVMPAAQLSISAENDTLDKGKSTKLNVTSKFFDPAPKFKKSDFSVAGNTSEDTEVVADGEGFKLNIGEDETASEVTVTVKAGDVTASVKVYIKGIVLTAADANVVKGGNTELKVTQNKLSETFTEANFTVEGNAKDGTKVTAKDGKYYLNIDPDETASKVTVKLTVSTYEASVVVGVADVVCNWTNSKFTVSAGNTATANLKVSGIPEGAKYTVKYVVTSGDEYASVSSSSSTSAKIKGIKAGSAIVTAYVYLDGNTDSYVAEADLLVTVTKKSTSGNNSSSNGSTSGGSIAGGTVSGGSTGVNISTRPDSYNPQFADLNEASWAADAINSLAKKGILTGRTDTEFAPNASVTRAEFVKMVSTLYNLVTPTSKFATQSFKDVPKDAWFFNYVEVCAQLGIVNGEGDGYFNPNALISRQEMAAIMYRTATIMGTKLTATEAVKTFADANEISDYAKAAVSALQTAGIISGTSDTTFEPALACTRAQAAVIINNMYTKYAK